MLSNPPPEPRIEVEAEGAGIFLILIILFLVVSAFIVYPPQTTQFLTNMVTSIVNWAGDIITGIGNVLMSFFAGLWNSLTSGATNAGKFVWNHTIGLIPGA